MTFTLTDLIEPLQAKIEDLQYQLNQAQKELVLINNKALKAEKPILTIESSAKELRSMFEKDPDILEKIINHIVDIFKGRNNTSLEKQEDSPVVADAKTDEEIVTKDVVEDVQQAVPEPTKDIADDVPAVENKVENSKVLATNKNPNKTWTPPSKNNPIVGIIQKENKVNNLADDGLKKIDKCTNAVELRKFYQELFDKHSDVAESVKSKILSNLTSSARAWDKYKIISEIIPPGTPLEHDNGNYKVDILYFVRPCADNKDYNQKYCEARTSKGNPKIVSFPEEGSNTRLAINAKPPSIKLQKQIEAISSNQVSKHKTDQLLQSVNIVDEINLVKDQPVPF